jgi:putative ABC transport system permease protein
MNLYTSLTLRYLIQNKKRTIVTIIGIILSTALICGIGNIYESYMDYQIRATIKNRGSFHATFYDVKKENLDYITKSSDVASAGLSSNSGHAKLSDENLNLLQVKEYDNNAFEGYKISLKKGKLPKNNNEIVISENSLSIMDKNYKIGDKITLNIGERVNPNGDQPSSYSVSSEEYIKDPKQKTFKIVGIMDKPGFESGNSVTTGITYLGVPKVSSDKNINVSIILKNPKSVYSDVPKIAQNSNIEPENIQYNEHLLRLQGASKYENINRTMIRIIMLVTSLVIVCTIATVYNAFSISISERKKQFGILNSIGSTSSQIMKLVFIEGFIVSIIGIPIGLLSGTFAIAMVFELIQSLFSKSFIVDMDLRVVYSPEVILISSIIVLITIFISVILPAITAAKISPLDAIRNTGDYKIGKVKDSKLVKAIFKTEGVIAYKNLRRNKKKFRITLFSLIISVVIFISFSGFMKMMLKAETVRSGQITSDISIYYQNQINGEIANKVINEIKNIPGINNFNAVNYNDLSLSIKVLESKINEDNKQIIEKYYEKEKVGNEYLYEFINNSIKLPGDVAISKLNLKEGSFDKEKAIDEVGVILVDKSYYEEDGKKAELTLTKYKVGDTIDANLMDYDEETNEEIVKPIKFKIMAITDDLLPGDYGYRSLGLEFITYDEVGKNLGYEIEKGIIYIDSDKKETTKEAIRNVANKYNYNFVDESEESLKLRQSYMAMEIFVYGFVAVISLVSITNIVNTISTNINLRKRELAVIRSIGVTPSGFNKMIYLESFLYGILSLIYGVPIGIGLNLLMNKTLADVIEFESVLPWEAIVISVIGIFVITFISSYIPIRKLNKENIIDNIRQESI